MSDGLVCDGCGDALLADSDVRYVLEIRGYAAYDPLEVSPSDLAKDLEKEMQALLEEASSREAEDLEAEVYQEFKLDLCPRCWRRFRRDPLGSLRDRDDGAA